jgi:signal transduction histidine kinase
LVHAVITLKLARRELGEQDGPATQLVDEALQHAEGANATLRELVHGMLPSALGRGGLGAGVRGLVARAPLPVSVSVTEERVPPALEATGYFIVAEALTNVIKYAHATRVEVKASVSDGALHIEVRDNGAGGARLEGSSGLIGLRDRAEAVEGELTVKSPVGGGTVVAARLPIPPA